LRRRADVIVAADNADNVAQIAAAARRAGVDVRVVIEVDIGMQRAGVASAEECLALAQAIAGFAGVRFAGVMGWEGHTAAILDGERKSQAVGEAVAKLTQCAALCRAHGLAVDIVSCGGTGTYWVSAAQPGITEIQAGGGVFGDVHYRNDYGVDHPYALTLMTTVTSRPARTRIICDAGKKAMSGDTALPQPIGIGETRLVRLSAEHATIELAAASDTPRVGDHLEFVVGYSDTTVHLHDMLYGVRNEKIETAWPILGRGRLQ